jgi:hypothetical protein
MAEKRSATMAKNPFQLIHYRLIADSTSSSNIKYFCLNG